MQEKIRSIGVHRAVNSIGCQCHDKPTKPARPATEAKDGEIGNAIENQKPPGSHGHYQQHTAITLRPSTSWPQPAIHTTPVLIPLQKVLIPPENH